LHVILITLPGAFDLSGISYIFEIMKSSLNKLILIFILTAFFSEICSDLLFSKLSAYSIENSQSDRGLKNVADSPFCFDSDAKDMLSWDPKPDTQQSFSQDHISPPEIFQISSYSLFIWQPPKIA
jgi:hypothetical protein